MSTHRRQTSTAASIPAQGLPMVWLTAGFLAVALAMVVGLLLLIVAGGVATFWPAPFERYELVDGTIMQGEVTGRENFPSADDVVGASQRFLVRTGNYDLTNEHYSWVSDFDVVRRDRPEWGVLLERLTGGRFYGEPEAFVIDGEVTAIGQAEAWAQFDRYHGEVSRRRAQRHRLESHGIGRVNRRIEQARLSLRAEELRVREAAREFGANSAEYRRALAAFAEQERRAARVDAEAGAEYERIRAQVDDIDALNDRYRILMRISDGRQVAVALSEVVRGFPPNQLKAHQKVGVYLSRWIEFLTTSPREANSEGGVFPAIFGTVVMTLIMSVLVAPFGVITALYLREYAQPGALVSIVRIAVNNLAGVPGIVFGVFGLGFFSYFVGGAIDQTFFAAKLPSPTFGTGGILWASLTLALLTLPVVIVATEEALAAVPGSMREGSYSCGASKWQTIRRIVLPRAMPGILTGMILAVARGAGEVAPLMLVGAVKLAPELPIDRYFPFIHLERSFMHLGFHIYDVGFQSQNAQAAKPMVFTTALLLIGIIVVLNLVAIRLRSRLSRRFASSQF